MKITGYDSGRIAVDDRTCTADVTIVPGCVIDTLWRHQGHSLHTDDLDTVVRAKPDVLVVGAAYCDRTPIPHNTRQYLESQGIDLNGLNTREAVPGSTAPGKVRAHR